MTAEQRLERDLPSVLDHLAGGSYPDYVDSVLTTTAQRRQRPRWTFPERWLPMDIATERISAPRAPWRAITALALIALLIIAAAAAYVGSQSRRLPAPFGPAANGSIVFARDGDIYTADPTTGATKAIVVGAETDRGPTFSPDGTKLAFGRVSADDPTKLLLFVADDAGRGLTQVTPEPVRNLNSWSFSPDGGSVMAFGETAKGYELMVFGTDGATTPKAYPVFATRDDTPPMYLPDGAGVMFIGLEPGNTRRGVYGLDLVTGTTRAIVAPKPGNIDIHGASLSPDGRHVAYGTYDPDLGTSSARTSVVATDGTGDVQIEPDPRAKGDIGFTWSNDGTRLIVSRNYNDDGSEARSVIVPVDRSGPAIEIGCPPDTTGDCTADWTWSPDDSVLLGTKEIGGQQVHLLADPGTGAVRVAPWTAGDRPVWQRLAP